MDVFGLLYSATEDRFGRKKINIFHRSPTEFDQQTSQTQREREREEVVVVDSDDDDEEEEERDVRLMLFVREIEQAMESDERKR